MSNDRMNEYYSQLEGYKIKKYLGEGDDGFPAFLLTAPHYKDIKIEADQLIKDINSEYNSIKIEVKKLF